MSIIFRYRASSEAMPGAAPVRVGHAVAGAIQRLANVETRVKWPNDVVVPERGKIAGILCEGGGRRDDTFIIAGIGINLQSPGGEFVSVADVSDRNISRADVLQEVVARLKKLADRITYPLSDDELAVMRARDVLFGQLIEAEHGLNGRALGIARDGALLVQTQRGLQPIYNATIRLAGSQAYPGAGR
jgi:BirA family biotin operon repressor/biotin-[acetyl-CoA-carboxylase] ligase